MTRQQQQLVNTISSLDTNLYDMPHNYLRNYIMRLTMWIRGYVFDGANDKQNLTRFYKDLKEYNHEIVKDMQSEFIPIAERELNKDLRGYEYAIQEAIDNRTLSHGMMGVSMVTKARDYYIDQFLPRKISGSIDGAFTGLANGITAMQYRQVKKAYNKAFENSDMLGVDLQSIVDEYDVGPLAASRARSLVNTAMSELREDARTQVEQAYTTYIKGWQFDAHLDTRTTEGCRSREDKIYYKPRPDATKEETVPADSMVPRHYNCRSMLIPVPYTNNEEWVKVDTEDLGKQIRETWELRRYFE